MSMHGSLSWVTAWNARRPSSKAKGKKMSLRPAVAIKLVVPEDTVLGKEIVAMRKAVEKHGRALDKKVRNKRKATP